MIGPVILARTISKPTLRGRDPQPWQYHSRSDAHSEVACWTLLLDLIRACDVLRDDAERGRLGFGINHVMVGPINKTLDLVLTRIGSSRKTRPRKHFAELVGEYGIELDDGELAALQALPIVEIDAREDVSEVVLALEAKACMTAHVKSLPRLHAEILATGYLAKKAAPRCILASYTLVNAAPSFVTPSGEGKVNAHVQPTDTEKVLHMLRSAVPRVSESREFGFDAVGVTVLDCPNDGSPLKVVDRPPAPSTADPLHYERMITALCSEYRARFA